jgi:hypothetical protein
LADRKQEAGGAPSIARLLEAQREEEGFADLGMRRLSRSSSRSRRQCSSVVPPG